MGNWNCKDCGRPLEFGKMLCRYCGGWTAVDAETGTLGTVSKNKTTMLSEVVADVVERIVTGGVWDEAWGGGIVPTTTTLMGGSPGLGKSTLLLQIASMAAGITGKTSYYLSAEQAPSELKMTTDRLQLPHVDRIRVLREFGAGADIDESLMKEDPPGFFVVDSLNALCGQDKIAAVGVSELCKKRSMKWKAPTVLICQMTKENDYAGLNVVQHGVDTLMTIGGLDSDREISSCLLHHYPKMDRKQFHKLLEAGRLDGILHAMRVLTTWKNRFGPTGQDYPLMMTPRGLMALPPFEELAGDLLTPRGGLRGAKAKFTENVKSAEGRPTTVLPPPSSEANVIGDSLHPPKPDEIVVDGQKLKRVKPKKKKKGWFTEAGGAPADAIAPADKAVAAGLPPVAADAKKQRRPEMKRTVAGRKEAKQRRKEADT